MASHESTTIYPVAEIGRRLALLQAAIAAADDLHANPRVVDGIGFGMAEDHLHDLLASTAATASGVRATTAAGALVQLGLALADVERLAGIAQPQDRPKSLKLHRRIHRLLYSVRDVLVAEAGDVAAELGAVHYMPAKVNPHDWLDRAITALGEE